MGLYINHPDMGSSYADKCAFVFDYMNGILVVMGSTDDKSKIIKWYNDIKDRKHHAVVVVDNGAFAAAGLASTFEEFKLLMSDVNGEDRRRKVLFSVPSHPIITKLLKGENK